MILSQATSYCEECGEGHKAFYEEREGRVVFTVECPRRPRARTVSSDSDLFAGIRGRSRSADDVGVASAARRLFYLIEITDACNLSCPLCYAAAGPGRQRYLGLDEVRALGQKVKADGGKWITLTGGEPTLHPLMEQIIRLLNREMNLSALIVTNGVRIAEDPSFLSRLKRAGLRKVQLQFDTLDDATCVAMRGRSLIREKLTAIDRIRSAGLRLGLVVTVCDRNIAEVGKILDYAATLAPALNTLVFQSAVPVGRYPGAMGTVDRETIIRSLCKKRTGLDLQPSDFFPPVQYAPWRVMSHPDCSATAYVCTGEGRTFALGRDVNVDAFYARLQAGRRWPGPLGAVVIPFVTLLAHTMPDRRYRVLRRLLGLRSGRGADGLFLVTVGSYMTADTRDEQRLALCTAVHVTASGFRSLCERCCTRQTTPFQKEMIAS